MTDIDQDLGLDDELEVTTPEVAVPEQDDSVWAQLRAEHAKIGEDREPLILEVPGYVAAGLQIRYKFVNLEETEATTKKLQQVRGLTTQALFSAIDTLLLACDEILVRLPDGVRPLADDGEPPIRFDHRLAEGMQWPSGLKARQIVHRLFGGKQGEYQILDQAREVSAWIAGERSDVGEEFLGK
jgi:hypothetical protein